jgi:hypothetical protein
VGLADGDFRQSFVIAGATFVTGTPSLAAAIFFFHIKGKLGANRSGGALGTKSFAIRS